MVAQVASPPPLAPSILETPPVSSSLPPSSRPPLSIGAGSACAAPASIRPAAPAARPILTDNIRSPSCLVSRRAGTRKPHPQLALRGGAGFQMQGLVTNLARSAADLRRVDAGRAAPYASAPCALRARPGGGIGRRAGFRCQWCNSRGGSSPLLGTSLRASRCGWAGQPSGATFGQPLPLQARSGGSTPLT